MRLSFPTGRLLSTSLLCSKGLYQKAEALYHMGEFEFALMFYHKGQKLRPQFEEFRLGIQKATKAIEDTIGNMYSSVEICCSIFSSFKIHISHIHISSPANFSQAHQM